MSEWEPRSEAAGHYWHTCSECDYDFQGPTNGTVCPICEADAACQTGGECVDDSRYTGGTDAI